MLHRTHAAGLSLCITRISSPLFADAVYPESDFLERREIKNVPAIEDEGRLLHRGKDFCVVEFLELIPLRHQGDRVGILGRLVGTRNHRQLARELSFYAARFRLWAERVGRSASAQGGL